MKVRDDLVGQQQEQTTLPNRCLVEDDMKEVFYGPCNQCGHEMKKPVRLFPTEQPLPILNCPACHAGMGKPIMEQYQMQLGMPLLTQPETVLA